MATMDRKPLFLVVEDNYILLEMLTTLCERQGIQVVSASSGEDAVTFLRGHGATVDGLFTDINLPGLIDGWTVADAYRVLNPGRPVVYASASPRVDRASVPGSLFLRKPFQVADLMELVRMMAESAYPSPIRAAG